MTPVAYPSSLLGEPCDRVRLNPMVGVVEGFRGRSSARRRPGSTVGCRSRRSRCSSARHFFRRPSEPLSRHRCSDERLRFASSVQGISAEPRRDQYHAARALAWARRALRRQAGAPAAPSGRPRRLVEWRRRGRRIIATTAPAEHLLKSSPITPPTTPHRGRRRSARSSGGTGFHAELTAGELYLNGDPRMRKPRSTESTRSSRSQSRALSTCRSSTTRRMQVRLAFAVDRAPRAGDPGRRRGVASATASRRSASGR